MPPRVPLLSWPLRLRSPRDEAQGQRIGYTEEQQQQLLPLPAASGFSRTSGFHPPETPGKRLWGSRLRLSCGALLVLGVLLGLGLLAVQVETDRSLKLGSKQMPIAVRSYRSRRYECPVSVAAGSREATTATAGAIFHPLCLVGNTESVFLGEAISQRYFPTVPALWMVWGRKSNVNDAHRLTPAEALDVGLQGSHNGHAPLQRYVGALNSTWASGIELGVRLLHPFGCEYMLFLDDDVDFALWHHEHSPNSVNWAQALREQQEEQMAQATGAEGSSSSSSSSSSSISPVEQELRCVLAVYRPAMVAFRGWGGIKRRLPVYSAASLQPSHLLLDLSTGTSSASAAIVSPRVSVAYAFDNSNVVFHRDLLPFLMPVAPRGEGGFTGQWTLPSLFFMMFVPRMYPGHALVAESIVFRNRLKPLAKQPKRKANDPPPTDTHLLSHFVGSRHVYETPQNSAYKAFLRSGALDFHAPFGVDMTHEDIPWTPVLPSSDNGGNNADGIIAEGKSGMTDYSEHLLRLQSFYDILHPAVTARPLFAGLSRAALAEFRAAHAHPRVQLIVFCEDRLASLQRLLVSLLGADYSVLPRGSVDLQVEVDQSPLQGDVRTYLSHFRWPHGALNVSYSPVAHSLRDAVVHAWMPASLNEFAIFLEEDMEVSPFFLRWAVPAIRHYYYGANSTLRDNALVGIALSSPKQSAVDDTWTLPQKMQQEKREAEQDTDILAGESALSVDGAGTVSAPAPDARRVYLFQQPCSRGAVYFPGPWRAFLSWFERHAPEDPLVPELVGINRWPMEYSWKKYLTRFMVQRNLAMLYPHFEANDTSLVTRHKELGTDAMTEEIDRQEERNNYEAPLLTQEGQLTSALSLLLQPLETLPKLDVFGRVVPSFDAARLPWHAFSKFSIIIPSHEARRASLLQSLAHYQSASSLSKIFVRWFDDVDSTAPRFTVPADLAAQWRVPVVVEHRGPFRINDRFLPPAELETLAVMTLDDDVRIDVRDVEFAFYAWQQHPDQIVGFSHTARSVKRDATGALLYGNPARIRDASIALTGAAFFHRRYLSAYWSDAVPAPALRDAVQQHLNGEDIVMNCVIARATGKGPLFVEGRFDQEAMNSASSLWRRPHHYTRRTALLAEAALLYNTPPSEPHGPLLSAQPFPAKWMREWMAKIPGPPSEYFYHTPNPTNFTLVD